MSKFDDAINRLQKYVFDENDLIENIVKLCNLANRNDLEIKDSNIRNAGNGLFAKRDYEFGDNITYYGGKQLRRNEIDNDKSYPYGIHLMSDYGVEYPRDKIPEQWFVDPT